MLRNLNIFSSYFFTICVEFENVFGQKPESARLPLPTRLPLPLTNLSRIGEVEIELILMLWMKET